MTALRLFDMPPDPGRFARGPEPGALRAVARPDDPETSRAAAQRVDGEGVCALVMAAHRAHPRGLTDGELVGLVEGRPGTIVTARSRLRRAGHLVATNRTRPSPETGNAQQVWRLA